MTSEWSLPIPPEFVGSLIGAIATIIGAALTIRIAPSKNRTMMKNFWNFLTTRKNVRELLGLDEIDNREIRYWKLSIISAATVILVIFYTYLLADKSIIFWIILFIANLPILLVTMLFNLLLTIKTSEKIMRIYKLYRIPVYIISTSGILTTLFLSDHSVSTPYVYFLISVWFLMPIPIDYMTWSIKKTLYNREISVKLKDNVDKMPIMHFSFKGSENSISGKFKSMNKEYLVIRDEHKDVMLMWKDLEIFSMDN